MRRSSSAFGPSTRPLTSTSVLEGRQLDDGHMLSRAIFRDNQALVWRTDLGEQRVKGIADEIVQEPPVFEAFLAEWEQHPLLSRSADQ